ncbi:hypothetical protein PUNSTDRAFT_69250 [Punctularia strigosozonata HHB-11173 SS5]|uniref:uncharacterized protein n=1 Tax=Punctularia strigosozonata (strain HHB-11173) TaxID=741275 RepID=UPI0004416CF9|nr:uncharacterized protein PUNSTDRAFT_69250 [Punctularia strigosozonata HHB-11173 SS5]EIN08331.1 hypothetical protein PUNSTDRAFT_69250 [Punctularia strigosozonata HHB-11173 SS5]
MHLIDENLLRNLILLWTSDFKGLDEGTGTYQLAPSVWDAIGQATQRTGDTIPSSYCSRPPNIAKDKSSTTADSMSFWSLYLGPVLLHRRFRSTLYYDHFLELVTLLHIALKFEYSRDDVEQMRTGFARWVERYETLYYQHDPSRISTCPVTIHALLHIIDGIHAAGPVWAYWAFPTERHCGQLRSGIRSRRFPFASLDRFVRETAQLTTIQMVHNLHDELSFSHPIKIQRSVYSNPAYESCVLLDPCGTATLATTPLSSHIIASLATRFGTSSSTVRQHLRFNEVRIQQWAKVRRLEGGDIMHASELVSAVTEDRRDATFIRYEAYVDVNARHRNLPIHLEGRTHYGQLRRIFVVDLPACPDLGLLEPTSIILAAIQDCKVVGQLKPLDIYFYSELASAHVVDIKCLQCVIGRVRYRDSGPRQWAIIDRSGGMARAEFTD